MTYILGLDLGTNSIGWAGVNESDENIFAAGVRIFPEGVDRDTKGKEVSKNANRRLARQSRRHYDRRRQRKNLLKSRLTRLACWPATPDEKDLFFALNPYELRKRGLDEKLSLLELGRVFFHINQRRGFRSSRKSGKSEDGKVSESLEGLQAMIDQADARTLGEYLAGLNPQEQRVRGRYLSRQMLEDEFSTLWDKQSAFHSVLTEEAHKKIHEAIFYQRPLKSQAKLIGPCSLEPDKRRCAKDAPLAQQYRVLEQVNRLYYVDADGVCHYFYRDSPEEPVTEEMQTQRTDLIKKLMASEKVTFDQIRKLLKLPEETRFNLEQEGVKKGSLKHLWGNRTGKNLSKAFKDWFKKPEEEQEKIYQAVHFAREPEWLQKHAIEKWRLSPELAEKLATGIHLESGYLHISKKAMRKLIPHLEQGYKYSDALALAGYDRKRKDQSIESYLNDLRNPIVKQALYDLFRLLKNIVAEHGEPEQIRIELARELKAPAKKREDMHFENLRRKNENDEIRQELQEHEVRPTGDALLRWRLWKECQETCPYTGDKISYPDLFGPEPRFEVEHILPYSRTLDDSYMNKTLCRKDVNAEKGNRSPYEAWGKSDPDRYEKILQRVESLKLPLGKLMRFRKKEIDTEGFIERQLNDTRYISRMAKDLLALPEFRKSVSPDTEQDTGFKVRVTKGQATGSIRHLWGLNSLLGDSPQKNRGDHRHHTLDAVVVALTDVTTLHKLSSYNKYDRHGRKEDFRKNWDWVRPALKEKIDGILVSYRTNKRARGALHEETLYGETSRVDSKGAPLYAVRKPITSLTSAMIGKIADPVVRGVVEDRLREHGVNLAQKKFTIPKDAFQKTLYMPGGKVPINKVRIHQPFSNIITLPRRNKTAVEPGNNHHIVLYRYTDSKGRQKQGGEICTLFEAVQRKTAGEPVVRKNPGPGKTFLMSLAINEMVLLDIAEGDIDWNQLDLENLSKHLYRVQKISNQITLRHHLTSILQNEHKEEIGRVLKTHNSFNGIKVRIDPIGRIFKAHD